ncbi:hypothetical protein QQF64_018503 [Cirrhinus molitorella]|uniref:Integrase catalytic domain-containing protein n=1 Tax=Cirrhinus molitorella TaxID=172907 RepID=A0ABR3LGA0_9TELE
MQSEQEVTEPVVRPRTQRERHPPAYLSDYDVGYQPSHIPTSSADAIPAAQADEVHVPCRPPSTHLAASSRHSQSRTKTSRSGGSSQTTASQLTELQAAIVEEKLKSMELAEMQRQMVEESKAEEQCEFLDQQARLALYEREDLLREQQRRSRQLDEEARAAHKTKELITKQLERQRRIKQKEMELEKARLIALLLRESETENASAVSQTKGVLDPEQVQTDILCLQKVEVSHHTPHQVPDNTQHSTPYIQGNPVTTQPIISHSVPDNITSPSTIKPLYAEPVTVVPSPIYPVVVPRVPPQQVKLPTAAVYPPTTVPPSFERKPCSLGQFGANLASQDSTETSYAQPPTFSVPAESKPHPPAGQLYQPVRQLQFSSQPLSVPSVSGVQPPTPINMMDMLIASSYGIPKPALPKFDSGKESDFALLKMALDSLIGGHAHLTEQFKYQVLLDRLKLPSAYKLAQAYMHDPTPYTTALQALQDKYGQPRQLVQSELGAILNSPPVRVGDAEAFDNFALLVHGLVGMLRSLEGENGYELKCGSHVDRLLVKLPASYRDGFVEHCLSRGILITGTDKTYTLMDLSAWLQLKSQAKRISSRAVDMFQEQMKPQRKGKRSQPSSSVYYNTSSSPDKPLLTSPSRHTFPPKPRDKPKPYCPYCDTPSSDHCDELKKQSFCGNACLAQSPPDISHIKSWKELLKATHQSLHGAAAIMTAADAIAAELHLLRQAQRDSFPEELDALAKGKSISAQSRLVSLSAEYDETLGLIQVGGRLRRAEGLDPDTIHPIILDPKHQITLLLIKEYDDQLLHPGPERVLGEIRRKYWILRGRESIKKHQYNCESCQKWRASPVIPKMADLPPSRLRLYKPPFWSTGIDCFGPFTIKIGRRTEKRWGIIFKCMTTSCIHLDLLESIDTDAFLLALRRFVSRRGKPFEILADRGTNFRGGATELQEAFASLEAELKEHLAGQEIAFQFNPPHAPHFGGTWEREIRSVKSALQVVLGNRTVAEAVLRTVLVEVEGILNSKPLGYVSSDVADPDPVTPNLLLMGRRDASLPQAIYSSSDLLGRRL